MGQAVFRIVQCPAAAGINGSSARDVRMSKYPCSDEWEAGSIKQPSISPAAGHGGGHQHSAPAAWGCSVCPVGRDPQSPQPSQSPWGLGLQAGHPLLMRAGQAQLHGCRSFCLWESLHAGKINLRDNTGPYCLSQVPTHASRFQEIFSWKQKL